MRPIRRSLCWQVSPTRYKRRQSMKGASLLVIALAIVIPLSVRAQSSSVTEMAELKAQLKAQQKQLEKEQAQIQTLESTLATLQKMLVDVVHSNANPQALVPADDRTVDVKSQTDGVQARQDQAKPSGQQPLSANPGEVQDNLQRGQEIADVTSSTPKLQLGPAGPPDRLPGAYVGVPLDELWWERRNQFHQHSL